jgi:hypothetical protein
MLPPVNPPRHLSEAISTKLGRYRSLHSRSVQAGAMLTSTRQIPAAISNFARLTATVFSGSRVTRVARQLLPRPGGGGSAHCQGTCKLPPRGVILSCKPKTCDKPCRRNRARIGPGDDNVPAEPDQIRSKREQPFQLAVREAVLDGDILASDCFREAIERYPIRKTRPAGCCACAASGAHQRTGISFSIQPVNEACLGDQSSSARARLPRTRLFEPSE